MNISTLRFKSNIITQQDNCQNVINDVKLGHLESE